MKRIEDMNEPELRQLTNAVCNGIRQRMPKDTLFTLLFWPNGWQVANYASNCNRSDMIKFLRETADILEKQADVSR